ncbi:TIGR03757 family integrating conjugative element protein [Xanthobacter autotrophicus]|uniref:TIGR03757 family integrating conjugative element protein n=1 Tax=Xanthobacter autotrophicus TaxID=280 RepID=UPI00372A1BC4
MATFVLAIGSAALGGTAAAEVKVFTTRVLPVKAPADVAIVYLDTASTLEARLSADLPSDPRRARDAALQRLREGGAKLQRDLAAAYQDVSEAWSLGITTLPAVVVDRRYVVYGNSNVASAIARIEAFRRTQP